MSDTPTPEMDAAELYYDGPTGFVPIEKARAVEKQRNKFREALKKISQVWQTSHLSFEAQSFRAARIANLALKDIEKEEK